MKGFILAAGNGTRLRPITYEIPKPLLPVGKVPVITRLINLYLKNGIDDIKINVQKNHLEDFYKWKATYFPREKIELVIEEEPSGTFTPIAKKISPEWFCEPIIVSNGDELKEMNLKKMIDWHKKMKAVATIALVKVKNPCSYGVAKLNKNRIEEFIEKPKDPPSPYINSGLYILNPEIREYYPLKKNFAMMETDLFPKLAKEKKLFGYKTRGRWQDVGTFERWKEAILNWHK